MTLIEDITNRFGTHTLVELTNHSDDGLPTTINMVRLQSAIDDAIGDFQAKTGILYDESKEYKSIIMNGVIYKLQFYKDLDGNLTNSLARDFYGALASLASRKTMNFRTRSDAEIARDTYNCQEHPLSRNNKIFSARRR